MPFQGRFSMNTPSCARQLRLNEGFVWVGRRAGLVPSTFMPLNRHHSCPMRRRSEFGLRPPKPSPQTAQTDNGHNGSAASARSHGVSCAPNSLSMSCALLK
jgi:hypothetical protein